MAPDPKGKQYPNRKPAQTQKVEVSLATPGKVTRVEQQSGGAWEVDLEGGRHLLCTPNLSVCLNAPARGRNTLLDPLLSLSHEEVEQMIQEKIAAGKQPVCGTLPLGGVFFGSLENYQRAVGIDNFQIQMQALQNMESSALAAVTGAVMTMQGQPDARILNATEAMLLLEVIVGAMAMPMIEAGRPGTSTKNSSSEPEPEQQHLHPAPRPRTVKVPRPPAPPKPVYPATAPGSGGVPRDQKLVDDLKLRSVPTLRDGSNNPLFDVETPSHMVEHFRGEQMRTKSDNPRGWHVPPGYSAQHPNNRLFKDWGEPAGTRLRWGTVEDNLKQSKREMKEIPTTNAKPIPGKGPGE